MGYDIRGLGFGLSRKDRSHPTICMPVFASVFRQMSCTKSTATAHLCALPLQAHGPKQRLRSACPELHLHRIVGLVRDDLMDLLLALVESPFAFRDDIDSSFDNVGT